MANRNSLRLSATLVLVGLVVYGVLQFPHPGSPTPTDQAQFAAHAMSSSWSAIHLGEFVGVMSWVAGTQGLNSSRRSVLFEIVSLSKAIWTIWLLIAAWRMKASVQASFPLVHPPGVSAIRHSGT